MLRIHLHSRCGKRLSVLTGVNVIQSHSCPAFSSLSWNFLNFVYPHEYWMLSGFVISLILYLNPYLCWACCSFCCFWALGSVCCRTVEQWCSAGIDWYLVFISLVFFKIIIYWCPLCNTNMRNVIQSPVQLVSLHCTHRAAAPSQSTNLKNVIGVF